MFGFMRLTRDERSTLELALLERAVNYQESLKNDDKYKTLPELGRSMIERELGICESAYLKLTGRKLITQRERERDQNS